MEPRSVSAPRPVRPRVPTTLARKLDRAAVRAHWFHRWAHHPLCERYRGEVVRIGRRTRLCRGCTMSAVGCTSGALLGALFGGAWLSSAIAVAVTLALVPSLLKRRTPRGSRVPKLITRMLPTFAWFFALGASARALAVIPFCATVLLIGGATLLYRRRGPDRSPCATCPEREQQPCSGFAPLVLRERAYQRLASKWLRGAGL